MFMDVVLVVIWSDTLRTSVEEHISFSRFDCGVIISDINFVLLISFFITFANIHDKDMVN